MSADPHKQQIPPLRCAPVGMTNSFSITFDSGHQDIMTNREYRIGIVGASSLAGKELSEELGASSLAASDFVLLDEEDAAGQVIAAADEVSFIQRLEASSFD